MSRVLVTACILLLLPRGIHAQIVQSVNAVTSPGDSELTGARRVVAGADAKSGKLLTQGNVDASPDGTKIGIQAADLWISKFFRFYGRLTVPVTQPAKSEAPKQPASATEPAPAPVDVRTLSATAKQQLVDPYGGLFNMSGGAFVRIGPSAKVSLRKKSPLPEAAALPMTRSAPGVTRPPAPSAAPGSREQDFERFENPLFRAPRAETPRAAAARGRPQPSSEPRSSTTSLAGESSRGQTAIVQVDRRRVYAAQARAEERGENPTELLIGPDDATAANKLQDDHGLFLDVRGGLKFLELPVPGESNPEIAGSKVNVFYSGIAGLKFITPLYNAEPSNDPAVDGAHRTGGLTLGAYYVHNYAADTSQSDVYATLLNRKTWAITGVVGWDLPNTSIAALTFSFTPKTSDTRMGKTFVFGVTLKNKKDEPGVDGDGAR
jgi:hypothetical protein